MAFAAALHLGAAAAPASRHFTTSDGVRLHYLEAGAGATTLVLVPGWTMPATIWSAQMEHFARGHRVIALDPRGQGQSEAARDGYTAARRGQDIQELLAAIGPGPVVLVGWSLGVLETLACVQRFGPDRVRALVLVDNSVGEMPPPRGDPAFVKRLKEQRAQTVEAFVRGMFRRPRDEAYLRDLVRQSLRVPEAAALALLAYREPREFWRDALYAAGRPVLYAVTPRFAEQAANVKRRLPGARVEIFDGAGHALFVDEPARFNAVVDDFLRQVAAP